MKKMSHNKIPFGLKNGNLVSVSDVESGLACGCVCPACHRDLQANKGEVYSHYFSHDPSAKTSACESAFETSIHLMAKQILSEEGFAFFPSLEVSCSENDLNGTTHTEAAIVEEEAGRKFRRVELEKRLEDIRPDIIAYIDDVPFLIEVAVTSFADSEKKKKIRDLDLPAIEVDLSSVDYTTTKDELRGFLIQATDNKRWLSNPRAKTVKCELKAGLSEKIRSVNEDILKERDRMRELEAREFRARAKRLSAGKENYAYAYGGDGSIKQYDPRWFVCEACRHLFKVPLRNAPYSLSTIPCPECDHDVVATPYR